MVVLRITGSASFAVADFAVVAVAVFAVVIADFAVAFAAFAVVIAVVTDVC